MMGLITGYLLAGLGYYFIGRGLGYCSPWTYALAVVNILIGVVLCLLSYLIITGV